LENQIRQKKDDERELTDLNEGGREGGRKGGRTATIERRNP
jgi:hypothetical protein